MGTPLFKVLIVDDEADIRESMAMTIESLMDTVEVLTATDGVEGLDVLQKQGGNMPVDLIVSDYRMPNMDGITFLTKARELYPDVPRLLITAYPDPALAVQAVRDAGVGLFIAKPFDPAYVGELLKAFAPK